MVVSLAAPAAARAACMPLLAPDFLELDRRVSHSPAAAVPEVRAALEATTEPVRRIQYLALLTDAYLTVSRSQDFRAAVASAVETLARLPPEVRAEPAVRRAEIRIELDRAQTATSDTEKRLALAALDRLVDELDEPRLERACALIMRAQKRSDLGDQEGAAADALQANRLSAEHGWDMPRADSGNMLVLAYRRSGLYEDAERLADDAVNAAIRTGEPSMQGLTRFFQAQGRLDARRYAAARDSAEIARSRWELVGHTYGVAIAEELRCRAYLEEGDIAGAAAACPTDLSRIAADGPPDALASAKLNRALLALGRGRLDEAHRLVAEAATLPADQANAFFLRRLYSVRARIAVASHDYPQAYRDADRLLTLADERRATERAASLAILGAVARVDRLQVENERLAERTRRQTQELESARVRRNMGIVVAAAVGTVLLVVVAFTARTRQMARERRRREDIVAERTRIAGEIHDTLLQQFAGLSLKYEAALHDAPAPVVARFRELLVRTDAVLKEARQAVWGLRSPALEAVTLEAGLSALAAHWRRPDGPDIVLDVPTPLPVLRPSLETALTRIVQEAVANAVNHAGATVVAISAAVGERDVVVRVTDDGRGFDLAERVQGHFGLDTMRERARREGGSLEIASSPGAGTVVVVRVPRGRTRPDGGRPWWRRWRRRRGTP
jgi:signal transduction histidine kinase